MRKLNFYILVLVLIFCFYYGLNTNNIENVDSSLSSTVVNDVLYSSGDFDENKLYSAEVSSLVNTSKEYEVTPVVLEGAKKFTLTSGGNIASGSYYLDSDVTISSYLLVTNNSNVTIDLNGHVLKVNKNFISIINAGSSLTIVDSNPNTSHYGTLSKGIWTYNASATSGVEIKGGVLTGGRGDRGGSFLVRGTFTLEGGTIAGSIAEETDPNQTTEIHKTTGGAGGAVFIDQNGKFIMNGGGIAYCASDLDIESLGGAVFIDAEETGVGTFIMNGGTITNCNSSFGGAVYVHEALAEGVTKQGIFEMNGGTISNNSTKIEHASSSTFIAHGGAIFVNGIFTMNGGTISNNSTYKLNVSYDGQPAYTGYGGGVYTNTSTATFTLNDGVISGNRGASGGGVMVWVGSTFVMNGGSISNNFSCGDGTLGNGGAVYVQSATFDFNNGTLENNWAKRYGGAININKSATLNLDGNCKIINNSANHGGGISQEDGDCAIKLDNDGIFISGNTARGGNGGGIFIEKGVLNFNKGTITNNIAGLKGGGLSLYVSRIEGDITVNMNGGSLTSNTAGTDGGGIDVFADHNLSSDGTKNDVVLNLNGGIIDGNTSSGEGGGIHVWVNENGTSNIDIGKNSLGSTITNNSSKSNGGAVSIYSGTINMYGGKVQSNITEKNGGGFYIGNTGTFTLSGGIIDKNSSTSGDGGGIYVSNGNIIINDGVISGNKASNSSYGNGGGLCVSSGTITMHNGNIENNEAKNGGGFYLATGSFEIRNGSIISGNQAENGGGGYVSGGTFNLTGGDTSNNIASQNGGGYYIVNTPTVNLSNGIIKNNEAKNGGGFYQTQNGGKTTTTTLSGTCYVNNNKATNGNGGGIYVDGGSTFRIVNGKVIYNSAIGSPSDSDVMSDYYENGVKTDRKIVYSKDSSAGVGGGVYIKNGVFTMKNANGTNGNAAIFGNTATYAAADLFAYGNGLSTFDAIPVSTMEKDDVYLTSTDWFEDYVVGEYHESLRKSDNGTYLSSYGRYNSINDEEFLVKADSVLSTVSEYICITLGTNVGSLIIKIDDYDVGSDNILVYNLSDDNNELNIRLAVEQGVPTKVVNLPIGSYKLKLDDSWSWRYNNSFVATVKSKESSNKLDSSIEPIFKVLAGQTITVETDHSVKNKKHLSKNIFAKKHLDYVLIKDLSDD